MCRTANLRRQHDAAVALVGEISALSDRLGEPGIPYRVGLLLAKLTGLLRIHFAQEDKLLYPYMIHSADPDASSTAMAFQAEMGGLGGAYEAFASRWSSGETIRTAPAAFRKEAGDVFAALALRIERENSQLYPLADGIEDWQVARSA